MSEFRGRPFLVAFILAAAATGLVIEGGAWWIARWLAGPPADRFRSSMFEFELAPGWQCHSEGTEFVCEKGASPHAAIIILAMKERGSMDTIEAYRSYLATPQHRALDGQTWTSVVLGVETQRIGGHDWVVGRQFGSELRNYYTDYYAALTSHKALLVTLTAHQSVKEAVQPQLRRMIESLLVFEN